MGISQLRNWIGRYRLGRPTAVLFGLMLAVGVVCTAVPAMARAQTMAGSSHHAPMPGSCCLNRGAAAHAIATAPGDLTQQLGSHGGHIAITVVAFAVTRAAQSDRTLRPPIRAPAAPSRPLYLLDCALLN